MGIMPWDSIVGVADDIITRIWPDKTEQDKAKAALAQAELQGNLKTLQSQWDNALAQIDVNKAEAASGSIFIAGWRPFIGWVCGVAFAWTFVAAPMASWIMAASGATAKLPALDLSQMMPVLFGMLGLGGYRTFEKLKRVNGSHS